MTLHRMCVQAPSVSETKGEPFGVREQVASSLGLEAPFTRSILSPKQWSIRSASPTNDPRHPSYTRFWPGSGLSESDEDVDAQLDYCGRGEASLAVMAMDLPPQLRDRWIEGEAEHFKKLSVQKGRPTTSHLFRLDAGAGISVPDDWKRVLRALLRLIVARSSSAEGESVVRSLVERPDPSSTNSGAPFFTTDPLVKAAAALAAPPGHFVVSARDWWSYSLEATARLRLPECSTHAFGLANRAGTAHKPWTAMRRVGPGLWVPTQIYERAMPRSRGVYMTSAGALRALRGLWAFMYGGLASLPGFYHTPEKDNAISQAFDPLDSFESDVSGMDVSVKALLQDAACEAMLAELPPFLQESVLLWRDMEKRPIVMPSWLEDPTTVRTRNHTIVGSSGCTHSGIKVTTVINTLICWTSAMCSIIRQGQGSIDGWLNGDFGLLVQGDDVLTLGLPSLNPAAWKETWAEVGLKAELLPNNRFLMMFRFGDSNFNVASRVVQGMLFPEYAPEGSDSGGPPAINGLRSYLSDFFVSLGFKARDSLPLTAAGKAFFHGAFRLTATFRRWYVSGDTCDQVADRAMEALSVPASRLFVSLSDRLRRDAPFSPSANFLYEYAKAKGVLDEKALMSMDSLIDQTSTRLAELSPSLKLNLLTNCAQPLWSGTLPEALPTILHQAGIEIDPNEIHGQVQD